MKEKNTLKIIANCLILAALLFLLCSCISFNIADWPSKFAYPYNHPGANWCGPVGAVCAYHLLYRIGPGIFLALGSAVCMVIYLLTNRPLTQMILRLIGLLILTAVASSTFYFFLPNFMFHFPTGSGGMLGGVIISLLKTRFAWLGTLILLSVTWLVGFLLLADTVVSSFFSWLLGFPKQFVGITGPAFSAAVEQSQNLGKIWQKLNKKQKAVAKFAAAASVATVTEQQHPEISLNKDLDIEQKTQKAPAPELVINAGKAKPPKPAPLKIREPKAVDTRTNNTEVPKSYEGYTLPPLELLDEAEHGFSAVQSKVVKSKAAALEQLLTEFNVNARVVAADTGPVVTMFELELAAGVKVSQISSLANDIARALGVAAVRVVAPLPGKHTIGIEVPNSEKEKVRLKNLMQLANVKYNKMAVPLFLGKDSAGDALVADLTSMPHLLIAGTTGSGKSVCINSIITSVLLTKRPDEVKMILIDPKMVEMTAFNNIPHLLSPIVTETQRAVQILEWATVKMDERYALLAEAKVKNIADFNQLGAKEIIARFNPSNPDEEAKIPKKLPYIVIIIDELADLMMTASKEIEAYIVRLAQKSRAVGIHIVLATQRPQATVVTGLIKSNMPTRIGFRVAARMDSRIILDQNGAETLLGQGDMLFLKPGTSELIRAQGTFLDDSEIRKITTHLKDIAEPQFHPELVQLSRIDPSEMMRDELFDESVRIVLETKRGSVSLLQRRLNIGYARASRIIEMMAGAGILGDYKGSQAREVMITLEEYEDMREQMEKDAQNADSGPSDAASTTDSEDDDDSLPDYPTAGQQEYAAADTASDPED